MFWVWPLVSKLEREKQNESLMGLDMAWNEVLLVTCYYLYSPRWQIQNTRAPVRRIFILIPSRCSCLAQRRCRCSETDHPGKTGQRVCGDLDPYSAATNIVLMNKAWNWFPKDHFKLQISDNNVITRQRETTMLIIRHNRVVLCTCQSPNL